MSRIMIFVRPAEGRTVRDPETRAALPASGTTVPETAYWLRRIADGSVIRVDQPNSPAQPVKE